MSSSFRAKLEAQPTVGVVLQSASPLVAHSMSAAGFDWLVIDPLHSPLSQTAAFGMQTAVGDANPTPVLMRVGGPSDRSGIQQATDTGAAGILVPNVRSAADIVMARRPTLYPPVGDRSLFAPVRAHHKEGMQVHFLRANRSFVVAIQLEKAPRESWDDLLELDFHVAVLDIPQLCVEIGLYDGLLAAPPEGDGRLASRLEPWLRVYQEPCAELSELVTHFAALCRKHGKVAGALLGDHVGGSAVSEPRHEVHRNRVRPDGDDGACRGGHRQATGQHLARLDPRTPRLRRGQGSVRRVLGITPAARAFRGLDPDQWELRGDAGRAAGSCRPGRLLPRGTEHSGCPRSGIAFPRRSRSPARARSLRRPQGHPDDRRHCSCSRRGLRGGARQQRRRGPRRPGRVLVQGLARAQHRARAPVPRRQGGGSRCRAPRLPALGDRRDHRRGRFRDGLDRQLLSGRGPGTSAHDPRVAAGGVQEGGQAVLPSR